MAYPFELPELGYAYDALEPHIDARTMEIHHSKHHAGYTANFNKALADHADLQGRSASHTGSLPEDWKGHRTGPHYACQGNRLVGLETLDAVIDKFSKHAVNSLAVIDPASASGLKVTGLITRARLMTRYQRALADA